MPKNTSFLPRWDPILRLGWW